MRLDDLTRELHREAEQARAWPMPAVAVPMTRHPHRRRNAALVLVSVAAVAAIIVGLPHVLAPDTSSAPGAVIPPASTPSATASTRAHEWTAVRCPKRTSESCEVPWILDLHGRQYSSGDGARQPVLHGSVLSRDVSIHLRRFAGHRLVMVGATHTGPGSRLVVQIGDGSPTPVEDDLALVPLPRSAGAAEVTIVETGEAARRETLVIEEYRPVSRVSDPTP